MPLIVKINDNRIYLRDQDGQAKTQLYGCKNWTYIKDRAEIANSFIFEFSEPCFSNGDRYIPSLRDEVFIYKSEPDYINDIRWFGGLITGVSDTTIQSAEEGYMTDYRIESQSFDIILDKELRQPQKAGLSWEELIKFILNTHFKTQISTDYTYILNPINAPPIRINNGNLRFLLKAMRQLTSYDYFVDAYKRLHVFQAIERAGTFSIDDQPENGVTVWDTHPIIHYEGRAIHNIVRQPFQNYVTLNDWPGESFTGKGDPTGQGGQLPLLRTPSTIEETTFLQDKFDNEAFNTDLWIEIDDNSTQHPDHPNQGYLFTTQGQCQVVGGTGVLGGVALVSQAFFHFFESAYLIQEFQLTNTVGDGYLALFTDGAGLATGNFKAGLRIMNGALKALDGTTLVTSLDTTVNYLLWVTMTADGWQYDIQGGAYATKQSIRVETGVSHASDYKVAPLVNKSLQGSINSVRLRQSDRGVVLEINGEKKVVGLESSDTDLPDIDAFLNVDETPALLKFRGIDEIAVISSTTSATEFTVATGQGEKVKAGQRLLVGDNIVEEFNGKAGIVQSVSGDTVTLVPSGITGLSPGQQVLINTTVPAKGDKIVVKYGYAKGDEAIASDQASIDRYGPFPITLEEKDHIKRFDDAQMESENYLSRYKDGILTLNFTSNNRLIPNEPEPMTAIRVKLNKRPDPIDKMLILQRMEIAPSGGSHYKYAFQLESSDPIRPLDDLFRGRSLIIGSDGEIRFSLNISELNISNGELSIKTASSLYIIWNNPEQRKYGEFKWKASIDGGSLDFSNTDNSIYLAII